MQAPTDLEKKIQLLAEPICRVHGLECLIVRFGRAPGGALLKVIIERAADREQSSGAASNAGVSIDDCVAVSRDLSAALDAQDTISTNYRLEVSSPGLERPLVKAADFERFKGYEIKLQTLRPVERRKRFQGILKGLSEQTVQLELEDQSLGVELENISKANLVYRFDKKH
ncbi:MAG: ribosome maturation factor RimP [Myxococcales bacterium]|nr:MAG: ribosome maturation factor RimP [Myxococcales bacterium]